MCVDNAKDPNVLMKMYNFLEYSENYSEVFGNLFQCYRDEAALDDDGDIVNFGDNNTTDWFKLKAKIAGNKDFQIAVPEKECIIFSENSRNAFNQLN